MKNTFLKIIDKYEKSTAQIENDFYEVWDIRNFYRIRRPNHIGTTMLGMSMLPTFIFFFIFVICFAFDKENLQHIRYVLLGGIALGCFVLTPIVNIRQRSKLKKYNYLVKDKTRDQIILDDFRNYNKRLEMTHYARINSKIIENAKSEIQNIEDREAILVKMSEEYTIIPKDKPFVTHNEREVKELQFLLNTYEEQLESKIKEFAIVNFFDKMFKCDWMHMMVNGMMIAMCAMMLWNLPTLIITNTNEAQPVGISKVLLMVLIPLVIGMASPFIAHIFEKNRQSKAFKIVEAEMGHSFDIKKYDSEIKSELEKEIESLSDKVALTCMKLDTINET